MILPTISNTGPRRGLSSCNTFGLTQTRKSGRQLKEENQGRRWAVALRGNGQLPAIEAGLRWHFRFRGPLKPNKVSTPAARPGLPRPDHLFVSAGRSDVMSKLSPMGFFPSNHSQ